MVLTTNCVTAEPDPVSNEAKLLIIAVSPLLSVKSTDPNDCTDPTPRSVVREMTLVGVSPDVALLHKAVGERTFPFPGQIYPVVFVTGMPSPVYPFMMAMRTWTSATCRSKSRAMRRCSSSFMQCIHCPAGLCK